MPWPQEAQAGPTLSFRRGLLWVPGSPPEPESWCLRPRILDPVPLRTAFFPQAPRAAQSLRPEWPGLHQQGRKAGTPPLPSLRPSTTCLRLGDPPPRALHAPPSSARDAGALSLLPLPPAPYLTTSPSFSHHVRTSGPPQNAAQSNPSVGNRSRATV